ncbi:MAG: GIN domain-containing protein [Janthinobacterium lividum]
MKTLPLLVLLLLFAPAAGWAQRSAPATPLRTETRALPSFTAIDVTDGIELVIQPGQVAGAVVDASTAQFRRMTKTVVEGTTLKIYFDYQHEPNWQGLVHSREVFKVVVTTQELRTLTAADGATVTLADALTFGAAGAFTVQLRSGASLAGAVQVQQLDLQLRGGSSARLSGAAATLHLRVTEGSAFRSPRLQADYCTAFASSASTARLAVRKTLDASSLNEATITYSGPAQLTQERHEQGGQISHF